MEKRRKMRCTTNPGQNQERGLIEAYDSSTALITALVAILKSSNVEAKEF